MITARAGCSSGGCRLLLYGCLSVVKVGGHLHGRVCDFAGLIMGSFVSGFRLRVGGHLYGRFCPSPTGRSYLETRSLEIAAGRLPPHTGGLLDAAQGPAELT